MRRSFRDALVGFSILGGVFTFTASMLWIRGIRIDSKSWDITATFQNASGLSEQSPVTYRGILVGSVGKINVFPEAIEATLEIDKEDLRLPKPVFAKVVKSSLLGGDVQVALISTGEKLSSSISILPGSINCIGSNILCDGETIKGEPLSSISSLTIELEKIIRKAQKEELVDSVVNSTKQFDKTQKELEDLILQTKKEIVKAEPIITEMTKASIHINNILAAIDNPKTLDDIQKTASSTRSLTKKIDQIGNDVSRIMEDKELMNAFRNVTIGLGELFSELYPSKVRASK